MVSWLKRTVLVCWRSLGQYFCVDCFLGGKDDPLLWYKDLERHSCGNFSVAMVQANQECEDCGQVEPGREGTFVGVYDGHGGYEASRFACDHLWNHLITLARQTNGTMNAEVISNAFAATEEGFLDVVREKFKDGPSIASRGSCCLVGVIWKGTLFVAHLGDSRAVLGHIGPDGMVAEQLTNDHNANIEEVRNELRLLHQDDPNIVVRRGGTWRVKGIIQVTRAIGDAYLKTQEFALDESFPRFHLREPLNRPALRADPSVYSRELQAGDRFVIFASDGLWELLSNEKAVEIVHSSPRQGIARRLLVSALEMAARARNLKYADLKKRYHRVARRAFHDDITVVVIFIDHKMLNHELPVPGNSVRGFVNNPQQTNFNIQQVVAMENELAEM